MKWQDIIIFGGMLLSAYALVPQIIKGFKDKQRHLNLQTVLINGLAGFAMSLTFFTLYLYLSAATSAVVATCWTILLYQTVKYK